MRALGWGWGNAFHAGSTAACEDRSRRVAWRLDLVFLHSHFDKGVQLFGGTNTAMPAKRRLAAAIATLLSVGIVATGCTSTPAPNKAGANDSRATVVRIVDGDTIVADVTGTETTIRLLNIDTPETKDPNEPVQCLGPEATEYMKSLLTPGDKIDLEYDVQRLDPYGRTLAGVYKNDSLVNADIAAAGLGVAVVYQPNERFYAEVKAAEQSAAKRGRGALQPVHRLHGSGRRRPGQRRLGSTGGNRPGVFRGGRRGPGRRCRRGARGQGQTHGTEGIGQGGRRSRQRGVGCAQGRSTCRGLTQPSIGRPPWSPDLPRPRRP